MTTPKPDDRSARGQLTIVDLTPPSKCPGCGAITGGLPFCPAEGTMFSPTFVVDGRYEARSLIGSGGTGFVFAAQHVSVGRQLALKVMRPEMAADNRQVERFLREARSAGQITHENVVSVLDSGYDDDLGLLYLVMERIDGRTLEAEMRARGAMPWRDAVALLAQICRAVAATHEAGVVHRDLTPRNILLQGTSGARVKLCDFGLSRQATGSDRITIAGTVIGTPAYAAPEQLRGDVSTGLPADVYAIGAIAYEMLSGALPIDAPSMADLIAEKLRGEPRALAERFPALELPEPLDALVMRCLARDPSARPASVWELEQALLAVEDDPAARPVALVEGGSIGSYRILEVIGVGGLGTVYLGEHAVIGTRAAIKVLRAEVAVTGDFVQRFVQEARAASEIGSPNIPRYYDFGYLPDGRPFAVMEYLRGETVAARLARQGRMPIAMVAEIATQTAAALERAHAAGIVHRDIKPENLFLTENDAGAPTVKILDFGIAKMMAPEPGAAATQIGFFLGTPFYCAPEQVHGVGVGIATDVYGLGATVFEMLTGQPPFVGDVPSVLQAKLSQDPPLVGDLLSGSLPRSVSTSIASMLARDPGQRMPTMRAVREAAAAWLEATAVPKVAQTVAPAPSGPVEHAQQRSRVPLIAAAALGVAVLVVAVIAIIGSGSGASPSPGASRAADAAPAGGVQPGEPLIAPARPAADAPPDPASEPTPPETAVEQEPPVRRAPRTRPSAPEPDRGASDGTGAGVDRGPDAESSPRTRPSGESSRRRARTTRKRPPAESRTGADDRKDVIVVDPFEE